MNYTLKRFEWMTSAFASTLMVATLAVSSISNTSAKDVDSIPIGAELITGKGRAFVNSLSALQQRQRMVSLLKQYHGNGKGRRNVRIVYFTPKDRKPLANYVTRLSAVLEDVREFYTRGMDDQGLGEAVFDYARDSKGKIKFHVVIGKRTKNGYSRKTSREILTEVGEGLKRVGIDADNETVLVFQNLAVWTDTTFSDLDAPYFGGWRGAGGFCWVVDFPFFKVENLKKKQPTITMNGDSRRSMGAVLSSQMGGVAHELGHSFRLPHSLQDPGAKKNSLMGYGNWTYGQDRRGGKGSFLSRPSCVRLLSHPSFLGSVKNWDTRPVVQLKELRITSDTSTLTVSGVVKSDIPIYAVIARFDDLTKNMDYDARDAVGCPDSTGTFSVTFKHSKNVRYWLSLEFMTVNGQKVSANADFSADGSGNVNWSDMCRAKMMTSLPFKGKATDSFIGFLQGIDKQKVLSDSPASLTPSVKSVRLASLKWSNATVGYGQPTRNRVLPERRWNYLTSRSRVYNSGFYAHTNANYVFDLGGKWKTMTALCCLQKGCRGSVRFKVVGDGKTLFDSGVVKNSLERKISVSVAGVRKLELISDDAGDGKNSDWGVWLAPRLQR